MQLGINQVEKIQRQAARFIYNDFSWNSSVSNMLHQLDLPMLTYHRDKARITFLYKIIHKLVDITPSGSYLRPNSRDTRGHPLKFTQLPTSIDVCKHSFFPSAIKLWNNLSSDIIESQSLEEFQTQLNNYILHSWTLNFNVNLCITLYTEVCTVNNHNHNHSPRVLGSPSMAAYPLGKQTAGCNSPSTQLADEFGHGFSCFV